MNPQAISFKRSNQSELLSAALILTDSEGWAHDAHALGAYQGDHIIAVAVFQRITTLGAEAHFGGSGAWQRRDIVSGIFKYAFDARRYRTLTFPIAWHNTAAQIAALKSGAHISGILGAGVIMDDDAITMTMTRHTCRWLIPSPNQQAQATSTPAPEKA